jgi:hypothetical protein
VGAHSTTGATDGAQVGYLRSVRPMARGLAQRAHDLGLVRDADGFAVQAGDGGGANDAGRTDRQSGDGASPEGVWCGHGFGLRMRGVGGGLESIIGIRLKTARRGV